MKITCESCQSKYTVSDEKVQGKTVKIKCKKCGATILVGAGGATTTNGSPSMVDAAPPAADGGSYLVNVAEGDQRSMSLADIVQAYNTSVVTADTYVWADGMADWQPLGQVDAIVAALHAGTSVPPAAAAAPAAEAPRAARRDPNRRSQDLFGGGFGTETARADDVATSAPLFSAGASAAAAPAASRPAGAREENSVLFSLSALTAKAGAASAPAATTTAANREDSGLIDLKALAASAQPSGGGAAAAASPLDLVPDNAGLFPLGMPPVTAPVPTAAGASGPSVAPPASSSKTGLFIGIGGVVAGLAIVGAFLAMKGGDKPPPPTPESTVAAQATQAPAATAAPTAEPTAEPSAEASAAPTASASASAAVAAAAPKSGGHYTGGAKTGGAAAKPAGGSKPAGAAPAAAAPAKPSKGNCGCAPGDLMCAMKCSTH